MSAMIATNAAAGAVAADALLPIRVTVADMWDEVAMELPASTTCGEVKRRALAAVRLLRDPERYVLKFRGAQVLDETRTLAEAGIVPNAALIVLSARRRPLR